MIQLQRKHAPLQTPACARNLNSNASIQGIGSFVAVTDAAAETTVGTMPEHPPHTVHHKRIAHDDASEASVKKDFGVANKTIDRQAGRQAHK